MVRMIVIIMSMEVIRLWVVMMRMLLVVLTGK
jgi:hypothetical protein